MFLGKSQHLRFDAVQTNFSVLYWTECSWILFGLWRPNNRELTLIVNRTQRQCGQTHVMTQYRNWWRAWSHGVKYGHSTHTHFVQNVLQLWLSMFNRSQWPLTSDHQHVTSSCSTPVNVAECVPEILKTWFLRPRLLEPQRPNKHEAH